MVLNVCSFAHSLDVTINEIEETTKRKKKTYPSRIDVFTSLSCTCSKIFFVRANESKYISELLLHCSKRISFVSVEQCRQKACQSLNEMSHIVGMVIIQDR
jgi:hypothetical protein